jgi:hypothetical protein
MKPSVLFIIDSDPRTSARPAEAIRIAAGAGSWKRVEAILCLCDVAVLALGESVDNLVDDDNFTRYLPIIGELGRPIYVATDEAFRQTPGQSAVAFERITMAQLAELAARSNYVVRF